VKQDEAAAKQESEYVNFVMLQRNDAFNVFSTWFRDALMSKVALRQRLTGRRGAMC